MDNKYIIIGVLCAIIAVLCCGIAYTMLAEHTEYITVHTVENGTSMEIPEDMLIKSNNSESGITVLSNDNTIVVIFNSANQGLAQVMGFSDIKNPIFGSEFSGNTTINDPTVAGCSLDGKCNAVYLGNNETHDNIIVISKNKDIVDHIIASIRWVATETEGSEVVESDASSSSSDTSNSQPSAYAYKSDGTPMYSEEEVGDYMRNKYGLVDYHVGENGYIDMDEPGYDDAGNKIHEKWKIFEYLFGRMSCLTGNCAIGNILNNFKYYLLT